MSLSKSILAFPDIKSLMEQALASENGVKVAFETAKMATIFRHRCNHFRLLDRKNNAKLYPIEHSLNGHSPYDVIKVCSRAEGLEIHLEKIKAEMLRVEEL